MSQWAREHEIDWQLKDYRFGGDKQHGDVCVFQPHSAACEFNQGGICQVNKVEERRPGAGSYKICMGQVGTPQEAWVVPYMKR